MAAILGSSYWIFKIWLQIQIQIRNQRSKKRMQSFKKICWKKPNSAVKGLKHTFSSAVINDTITVSIT